MKYLISLLVIVFCFFKYWMCAVEFNSFIIEDQRFIYNDKVYESHDPYITIDRTKIKVSIKIKSAYTDTKKVKIKFYLCEEASNVQKYIINQYDNEIFHKNQLKEYTLFLSPKEFQEGKYELRVEYNLNDYWEEPDSQVPYPQNIYVGSDTYKKLINIKPSRSVISPTEGGYRDFPHYMVTNNIWRLDKMKNNDMSIGTDGTDYKGYGCTLASYAMIFQAAGRGCNPRFLNNFLLKQQSGEGYDNQGLIIRDKNVMKYIDNNPNITQSIAYSGIYNNKVSLSDLKNALNAGKVAIVSIEGSIGHWYVVYKYEDSGDEYKDFLVKDPTYSSRTNLSYEGYKDSIANTSDKKTLYSLRYYTPSTNYTFFDGSISEIYEYKKVTKDGSITISPERNSDGYYFKQKDSTGNFKKSSFEYMGSADLFTASTDGKFMYSKTIVKMDSNETLPSWATNTNNEFCYTQYFFEIQDSADYTITASIPSLSQGTTNAIYKILNEQGTVIAESESFDQSVSGMNKELMFNGENKISLDPGKYRLYVDNVTGTANQQIAFTSITISHESAGAGHFVKLDNLSTHFWQSSSDFADMNNDGLLDLVIMGKTNSGQEICVYYGIEVDGKVSLDTNAFVYNYTTALSTQNADFKIGDMNNDGLLDIVIVGSNGVMVILTSSDGSLSLKDSQDHDIDLSLSVASVALGDLDNDGDLDIVAMGRVSGDDYVLCWYENTINTRTTCVDADTIGKFVYHGVGPYGLQKGAMGSMLLRDYNGDGILDMLITGRTDGIYDDGASFTPPKVVFEVLRGSITNGEVTYTVIPIPTESNQFYVFTHNGGMDWADADGDGDLDILIGGMKFIKNNGVYDLKYIVEVFYYDNGQYRVSRDAKNQIYIDDGLNDSWEIGSGSRVKWYDFNGDGKLDIIAQCEQGYQKDRSRPKYTLLFENTGNTNAEMFFTRRSDLEKEEEQNGKNTGFVDSYYGSISLADFNNDKIMDVVISGKKADDSLSTVLYSNEVSRKGTISTQTPTAIVSKNKRDENKYSVSINWEKSDYATYDLQVYRYRTVMANGILQEIPEVYYSVGTGYSQNVLSGSSSTFSLPYGNMGKIQSWQLHNLPRGEYKYSLTAVYPNGTSITTVDYFNIYEKYQPLKLVSPDAENPLVGGNRLFQWQDDSRERYRLKIALADKPLEPVYNRVVELEDSNGTNNIKCTAHSFNPKPNTYYVWQVVDVINYLTSDFGSFYYLAASTNKDIDLQNINAQVNRIYKLYNDNTTDYLLFLGREKHRSKRNEQGAIIGIINKSNSDELVFNEELSAGITPLDNASAAIADLNADTYNDFVITGIDPQTGVCTTDVYLYNTSTERYVKSFSLQGVKNGTIDVRDYDGDGDLDILIAGEDAQGLNYSAMVLEQKEQNGSIAFAVIRTIPIIGTKPIVAWDDTDADGILDVLVMTDTNSTVYINADPAQPQPFTIPGYHDGSATFADLQPDPGKELVVSGKTNGNYETILYTKSDTSYIPNPINIQGAIYAMQAMDFNRDGSLDLVVSSRLTSDDALYKKYIPKPVYRSDREQVADGPIVTKVLFNRNGYFEDSGIELPIMKDGGFTLCDYDNDGKQDIILTGTDYNDAQVAAVYINNDFAFFEPPVAITPEEGATVGTTQVALTWEAVENAQSYNVQVSDKADFTVITDVQYGDFTA